MSYQAVSYEWTPKRLRAEMTARRMSQETLAAHIGRSDRIVRAWLKGEKTPGPQSQQRLDALFGHPAGERVPSGGDGVDRRQLFTVAGVLVVPTGVAAADDGMSNALYGLYATAPPQELIDHARINATRRPSPEAYAFAGWLARMTDAGAEARQWFALARDLAAEAGDDRAQAQALMGLSLAYEGSRAGLEMVEHARDLAADADPWTRMHVELLAAGEYAHADERSLCHSSLWRAERFLDRADPAEADGFHSPAGRYSGWNPAFVATERARCEVILDDGRRALEAVAEAEGVGGPGSPRSKTVMILYQGWAYALLDEPEPAAEALSQAWTRARATGHDLAATLTLQARRALNPRSHHSAVRTLDELIVDR